MSSGKKILGKNREQELEKNKSDILKKVFQHTCELLEITPEKARKRLPELLTAKKLILLCQIFRKKLSNSFNLTK